MARTLTAVFDGSVLRPEAPLELKPNTRYRLRVEQELAKSDSENAWDTLEALIGTEQQPADWAAEHDHYLYGTPKGQERAMTTETIRQEQLNTPESPDISPYVEVFKELVQARYPTATFYLAPGLEENTWHLNIFAPVEDDLELEGQLSEKATDFLVFDDVAISPIFLPQRTLDGLTDTERDRSLHGTPQRADG